MSDLGLTVFDRADTCKVAHAVAYRGRLIRLTAYPVGMCIYRRAESGPTPQGVSFATALGEFAKSHELGLLRSGFTWTADGRVGDKWLTPSSLFAVFAHSLLIDRIETQTKIHSDEVER